MRTLGSYMSELNWTHRRPAGLGELENCLVIGKHHTCGIRGCQKTYTCLPPWTPGHCLHGCPPFLRTWSWCPWSFGEVLHPRLWVNPDACLVMATFKQFVFNEAFSITLWLGAQIPGLDLPGSNSSSTIYYLYNLEKTTLPQFPHL